jgi:phosphohistidine phosphatase
MKTLYVIRHAKSSWDDSNLSDFDRPLNERGKRDAPRMGKRLKEREIAPGLLLSSPAKRAYSTAKRIGEVLNYKKENIKLEEGLYHASDDKILEVVKNIPDKYDVVFILAHNPGLTDFVNLLSDSRDFIENVPTCGVVGFEFRISSWKEINKEKTKRLFFDFPKSNDD